MSIQRGTYLRYKHGYKIHLRYIRDTCICRGDQDINQDTYGIHLRYIFYGIHVQDVSQMHPERDVSDMKETYAGRRTTARREAGMRATCKPLHARYMQHTCILRGSQ